MIREFTAWQDISYAAEATRKDGDLHVDVKAWKVAVFNDDGSLLLDTDGRGHTASLDEAEVVVTGYIRWDGCSNFYFGEEGGLMLHFCGVKQAIQVGTLLERLYEMAAELIPEHEPDILRRK